MIFFVENYNRKTLCMSLLWCVYLKIDTGGGQEYYTVVNRSPNLVLKIKKIISTNQKKKKKNPIDQWTTKTTAALVMTYSSIIIYHSLHEVSTPPAHQFAIEKWSTQEKPWIPRATTLNPLSAHPGSTLEKPWNIHAFGPEFFCSSSRDADKSKLTWRLFVMFALSDAKNRKKPVSEPWSCTSSARRPVTFLVTKLKTSTSFKFPNGPLRLPLLRPPVRSITSH